MAINAKAVKARIKSVTNTKKITKAMEMVSAAKMRKAVEAAQNTRLYATLGKELMEHLAHLDDPQIALLEQRPVKKVLAVVISSNRGLCGSFNTNVYKKAAAVLKDTESVGSFRERRGQKIQKGTGTFDIDVLAIGKKGMKFARHNGYDVSAVFDQLGEKPDYEQVRPIAQMIRDGFTTGSYDKVVVAYTEFQSSLVQEPKVRQLLPLSPVDLEKMVFDKIEFDEHESFPIESYLFEPSMQTIIDQVLPRLVEIQLYQAVLESGASEHSARMVAMKNASENAGDMIKELNLAYNKARQAAITQEIAEIAGGAAALE